MTEEQTATEQPWGGHDLQDPAGGPLQRHGVHGGAGRALLPQVARRIGTHHRRSCSPRSRRAPTRWAPRTSWCSPSAPSPARRSTPPAATAWARKSPLSGGIALCQSGEHWGAELKKAGYDVLIVEGKAEKPVYLSIKDGEVSIRDAGALWGLLTKETQAAIREELGDKRVRVAMIGPGGENLVPFACIMNGPFDAAGRGGLGAVMGSKNLKAIAVRGHRPAAGVRPRGREGLQQLADQGALGEVLDPAGAAGVRHRRPGDGGHGGDRPPAGAQLEGRSVRGRHQERPRRRAQGQDGPAPGGLLRLPAALQEAAAVRRARTSSTRSTAAPSTRPCARWAPTVEVDDAEAMVKANEICNAYSLDVISVGNTIVVRHGVLREGPADPRRHAGASSCASATARAGQVRGAHRPARGHRRPAVPGLRARRPRRSAAGPKRSRWRSRASIRACTNRASTPPSPSASWSTPTAPTTAPTCTTTSSPPSTASRTSTSWASTTRCRSLDIGPRKVALFKVGHIREFLNDCLLTCHLAYVGVTYKQPVEILQRGRRLGRQRGRADPQRRAHPHRGPALQRRAGSDGGRRPPAAPLLRRQDRRSVRGRARPREDGEGQEVLLHPHGLGRRTECRPPRRSRSSTSMTEQRGGASGRRAMPARLEEDFDQGQAAAHGRRCVHGEAQRGARHLAHRQRGGPGGGRGVPARLCPTASGSTRCCSGSHDEGRMIALPPAGHPAGRGRDRAHPVAERAGHPPPPVHHRQLHAQPAARQGGEGPGGEHQDGQGRPQRLSHHQPRRQDQPQGGGGLRRRPRPPLVPHRPGAGGRDRLRLGHDAPSPTASSAGSRATTRRPPSRSASRRPSTPGRLIGYYADHGVIITTDCHGWLPNFVIPMSVNMATQIIEALISAEQGVKSVFPPGEHAGLPAPGPGRHAGAAQAAAPLSRQVRPQRRRSSPACSAASRRSSPSRRRWAAPSATSATRP